MKRYTKEEAISVVVRCAEKYREELDGRSLLFVCVDKHRKTLCIEFSFHGSNYMHLTGLKPRESSDGEGEGPLFANDFYHKCLDHRLSPSDFAFSDDGTTHLKLDILPSVICKNLRASIIGEYNSSRPRLYTEKIVGNIHACMGFVYDRRTSEYVPNTVIKEDARDLVSGSARVIAVYRKDIRAAQYEEATYIAKKVDWDSVALPEGFMYLPLPHGETATV